ALQKVRPCAGGQRAHDVGLVAMYAENNNRRPRIELLRARSHLNAAQLWHADVENDDVGTLLLAEFDRFESVGGFGGHRKNGRLDQTPDTAASGTVVIT